MKSQLRHNLSFCFNISGSLLWSRMLNWTTWFPGKPQWSFMYQHSSISCWPLYSPRDHPTENEFGPMVRIFLWTITAIQFSKIVPFLIQIFDQCFKDKFPCNYFPFVQCTFCTSMCSNFSFVPTGACNTDWHYYVAGYIPSWILNRLTSSNLLHIFWFFFFFFLRFFKES